MNRIGLKEYNNAQISEILKYKWIESQKCCFDIGENRAAMEWISKYAEKFREHWYKEYIRDN